MPTSLLPLVDLGHTQQTMSKLAETLADIERIASISDPVLRNLWITQRYHDLSKGLADVVQPKNLNWSSFACWASLTAGISIRNRELPQLLITTFHKEHRIAGWTLRLLGRFGNLSEPVLEVARGVLAEVSAEVAAGNLKVFHELAPLFAKFVDLSNQDGALSPAALVDRLELRAGSVEQGGQDLLRKAFTSYAKTRAETDRKKQAQLVLFGNCLIGLHEQTRLQEHIQGALEAPIDKLLFDRLRPATETPVVGRWLTVPINLFSAHVKRDWDKILTRYAMNLSLPNGQEISLHNDVPSRAQVFPDDLRNLDDADLVELLGRFDPHLDTLILSGANNWADLNDRMGFIVDLFRSRQQDLTLFGPPFKLPQLTLLQRGIVPSDLDPSPK